jgi:NTP pyrophosphatase (non-canonical NTP hydrolase)
LNFRDFYDSVKETAQYRDDYSVVYPALGLAGESGEAVDIVKKSIRYKYGTQKFSLVDGMGKDRTEAMKLELGDVLWYWCNLCKDLGFEPEELFKLNYDKLRKRYEKKQEVK